MPDQRSDSLPANEYITPEKYFLMRDAGSSPQDIYLALKADEVGLIESIRILRELFQFSLPEAKEVVVIVEEGVSSLEEHQERLLPIILEAIENTDWDAEFEGSDEATGEADAR
jgi:hypothetical protein